MAKMGDIYSVFFSTVIFAPSCGVRPFDFIMKSRELFKAARDAVAEERGIGVDEVAALPEDTILGEKGVAALGALEALYAPYRMAG